MPLMTKKETIISGVITILGFLVGFVLNQTGVQGSTERNLLNPFSIMFMFSSFFYFFIITCRFEELNKEGSLIKYMIAPIIMTLLAFYGYDWFPKDTQGNLAFGLLLLIYTMQGIFIGKFRTDLIKNNKE